MRKLGILVRDMNLTNVSYDIFRAIEKFYEQGKVMVNINLFCLELSKRKIFTRCPVYSMSEIYGFDGVCVSIGSDILSYSLNNLSCPENHLFVPDMEWLAFGQYDYEKVRSIYNSEYVKSIYFDSGTYKSFFENNFNRKVKLVKNFTECLEGVVGDYNEIK